MPILIMEHAGERRVVPIHGRAWIGREHGCDLVVNHPIVSRRHASVDVDPATGTAVVADNGSRNGVLIAGQRLDAPRTLRDGDIFQVGPATLAFRAADAEAEVVAPSVDSDDVRGTVFACDRCNARLWAPRGSGGTSTVCPQCRQKVRVPVAGGAGGHERGTVAAAVARATGAKVCPKCDWKVEPHELFALCPDCGATYHAECWHEHEGCAVDACPRGPGAPEAPIQPEAPVGPEAPIAPAADPRELEPARTRPAATSPAAASTPDAPRPLVILHEGDDVTDDDLIASLSPDDTVAADVLSRRPKAFSPTDVAGPADERPAAVETPLLLAAVIASLVGLVAYGAPAALVGFVAAGYALGRPGRSRVLLVIAAAVGFIGAVAGVLASLYWWMDLEPSRLIGP